KVFPFDAVEEHEQKRSAESAYVLQPPGLAALCEQRNPQGKARILHRRNPRYLPHRLGCGARLRWPLARLLALTRLLFRRRRRRRSLHRRALLTKVIHLPLLHSLVVT